MHRLVVALALVPGLLTAAACGGEEEPATPPPSTAVILDPEAQACQAMLPDARAEQLAGMKTHPPVATRVGTLDACRWDLEVGEWIQVVDVPAQQWAKALPAALLQAAKAGQLAPRAQARLTAELKKLQQGEVTGARACGLFDTWATELLDAPTGSDSVLSFVPAPPKQPQAVNAQRCVDGVYTSVLLVDAELFGTREELEKVREALAAVVSRPAE